MMNRDELAKKEMNPDQLHQGEHGFIRYLIPGFICANP